MPLNFAPALRFSAALYLFFAGLPAFAAEAPTMETVGPTVIKRTIEEPEKGSLSWNVSYMGEYRRNVSGGIREGGVFLGLAAARAGWDLERAWGWRGLNAFVHLQALHGKAPSSYTGDFQFTSNIEAGMNAVKLYEAWLEQTTANGRLAFLLGIFDVNSAFNLTETAAVFLNSSFGMGAELSQTSYAGRTASTFPSTALGARVKAYFPHDAYLQVAVFDAVPGKPDRPKGNYVRLDKNEGALAVAEAGWQPGIEQGAIRGKLAVGAWAYSKAFPVLDAPAEAPASEAQSQGLYVLAERRFEGPFSAFFRYGVANAAVNRASSNIAFGGVAHGLIPGRADDDLALGVSRQANGINFRRAAESTGATVLKNEDAYELTYNAVVTSYLSVQPDFQYVVHPGGDPALANAFVASVRITASFGN